MSLLDYEERTLEAVSGFLGNALPNSVLKKLDRNQNDKQLLLLMMPQLVAGFGFTSRDLKNTYSSLYGAFKREYAEHRNEWDNLDLAFVLCVPEGLSGLQAFGSSVETDVYFCRKFVVPVDQHVGAALARLPFLPLATERGVAVRPPSAQTFLQESGVPSVLARHLVKKGERSARSVIDECVEGSFGELRAPERSLVGGAQLISTEDTPIRVQSISIEGFRAYRTKRELSFGDDLTVLFGPNGFGKTSVFDAIDFAFTGEIGRLQTRSEGRFRHVAAHLDSENGGSEVALTVGIDGKAHHLVRRVTERKSADLNGVSLDRKATLEKLTGWRGPGADRIENIVSLFRATHLFSQERQELARDFQPQCRLSSQVVARLLAYEDYHATRAKVSDICDIATREILDIDGEIEKFQRQMAGESEELETLGRAVQAELPDENLSALVEEIAKRISAVGIKTAPVEPRIELLRSWRTSLETRSSSLERQGEELRKCAGLLKELPRRREALAHANKRLEEVDSTLADATKRVSEVSDRLRNRASEIGQLEVRLKYLIAQQEKLAWVEKNKELHYTLQTEMASTSEQLTHKTQALDQLFDRDNLQSSLLRELEARRESATRALSEREAELQRTWTIGEGIEGWQAKTTRLSSLTSEEEELKRAVFEFRQSEEHLRTALHILVQEEDQLTTQIERIEAKRGELVDLIGALEGHIEGGVCPTCGQDHGSQRLLLERIAVQLGQDVAADERVSRDAVRTQIETRRSSIHDIETKIGKSTRQLGDLAEERDKVTAEIEAFRDLAQDFAVLVGNDADAMRRAVATKCARLEAQIKEQSAEIARVTEELETARREREATITSISRQQEEINEFKGHLEVTSTRLARLLDDSRNRGDVGLGSPEDAVRQQRSATEAELASMDTLLEETREGFRNDEESLSAYKAAVASSERETSDLTNEREILSYRCLSIERELTEAEVELVADPEDVLRRAHVLAEEASVIDDLIEEVARVELVIDAATTRAAYRRLQSRLAEHQSRVSVLSSRREIFSRWNEYFSQVLELVSSEQNEAVSSFTREYGPRTSVIQRRLRSVYGFDDINIRSQDSDILVRVLRNGKSLRPTDYFSQSQQQTLLLGLFLTACVSQTWSGLAPIFLDDPIAHFDDLNVFAFLDLIDGLMNDNGAGRRQFVISTCDQKFYELAREKFAYRGESVKYYSFEGIGEDGPIVRPS